MATSEDHTATTVDGGPEGLFARLRGERPSMSSDLTTLLQDGVLNDDEVLAGLFAVTKNAEALATGAMSNMSVAQFDASVMAASGLDAALVEAELQGTLAKHGLTPFNTVEGLIKLRGALVQAFKDNTLVPAETRLRATELEHAIHLLEVKRDLVVQTEISRATTSQIAAGLEAKLAEMSASTTQQIAALTGQITVLNAGADAQLAQVDVQRKIKTAEIDQKLILRQKRVEAFSKSFTNMQEMRRTIFAGVFKPLRKWALLTLIPLILTANLVADGPGRKHTPILGTVNHAWDAIYTPIRDGVVRVYHDVKKDEK